MRMLFTSNPGIGHVNPMFPVAAALTALGHQVAFATAAGFCPTVEARGFKAFPAGLDWIESEPQHRFPEYADLSLSDRGTFLLQDVFADMAAHPMTRDLLVLAREWKADALVRNDYEFGACVAAEVLAIPLATVSICFLMAPAYLASIVGDRLAYLRSAFGLSPQPSTRMLYPGPYFSYAPASMEPRLLPEMEGIQPADLAYAPAGSLPPCLEEKSSRPLIYISLGTVFNLNPIAFQAILEGLRDEPVDVLATVGRNQDPSAFGPQPANVFMERFVEQEMVFPRASLFITHSPFYTAMSALRFGVPLLMVPLAGDQPAQALRLARQGAGTILWHAGLKNRLHGSEARELTPSSVRNNVRSLLAGSHRASVQRIREQIVEMPDAAHAATVIEALAHRKWCAV